MRRKVTSIIMVCLMVGSSFLTVGFCHASARANEYMNEEIISAALTTVEEFQKEIVKADADGTLTDYEAQSIIERASADVYSEYIQYVDERAAQLLEDAEPIDTTYDSEQDISSTTYFVEVDPMSSVKLVLIDQPEVGIGEKVISGVRTAFAEECYAASQGDTLWKNYGSRYYTAKYTRNIGPGVATICSENHYKVSKNGITEKYATTWLDSMASVTGDIYERGYSLYDAATKAGQTTGIKVRITFKYSTNAGGIITNSYSTIYEKLNIKYVQKDAANERIKVKYTWSSAS